VELPDGEEIMTLAFFVLIQTDRRTDGQTEEQTDTVAYLGGPLRLPPPFNRP